MKVLSAIELPAKDPAPLRPLSARQNSGPLQKSSVATFGSACDVKSTNQQISSTMAGIKRKSAVATPAGDSKSKSKKVKVEKTTSKGDSKHAVKPVKKSKKAKEESSDELEESDTSEQENGFYGFSANEDVEMSDADSSEEAEPMEDVKQNGKAHKHKSDDKESDHKKKPKGDGSDSKLAELNGMSTHRFPFNSR